MAISLQRFRGALALVGNTIDGLAATTLSQSTLDKNTYLPLDPTAYHVTLACKDELRTVTEKDIASIKLDTRYIFSLGIGGNHKAGVYWVVIVWAAGQQIRKQLGLPPKHFHITLTLSNQHDIDKGISSLLTPQPNNWGVELLDHLVFTLQTFGNFKSAAKYASILIARETTSHKGFLRLADASFAEQNMKLAMLSYACAYQRSVDAKVQSYSMKKLVECSRVTEWGHTFQELEISQLDTIDATIKPLLLKPWPQALRDALSEQEIRPTLLLEPRQSLFIPTTSRTQSGHYKLPRFFRWLIPYHFAIMSTPRNQDDIVALSSSHLGIRHVLTLTEEQPLPGSWFKSLHSPLVRRGKKITNTFLPIPNYHPPSIEQMDLIIKLLDDPTKQPLLVHCGGGKGRAGTVAACYLAAFGFAKPTSESNFNRKSPSMSAQEAIDALRALRPGSLETKHQEEFVSKWCSHIWKRRSIYPDRIAEPAPCPLEVEAEGGGASVPAEADLFVLVGLPGSGKSWFCNALLARNPQGWNRISQDEAGSRSACENAIGRAPSGKVKQKVILDRCNTSSEDRKSWLGLASNWAKNPVCIWFDYQSKLCEWRAQSRAGHPTLPPGGRVRSAIKQMEEIFVRPTVGEGFKAVYIVRSFEASMELVNRLSPPIGLLKFPRTPHLLNVGAATEDDVHVDLQAFSASSNTVSTNMSIPISTPSNHTVVITEKIDGANMGFTLSSDRTSIIVQNRSHTVTSNTHPQFKKLGLWIERHEAQLHAILGQDELFAERYVLYGEWCYAKHSIPYTDLPDWFMAYDLFDRTEGIFVDRQTLETSLEWDPGSNEPAEGIQMAPVIYEGKELPEEKMLLAMIQKKSAFYDGKVEGVYVKVEADGVVKMRGKVVRGDFIAGNEHWTKGGVQPNGRRIDDNTR